MRHCWLIGTSLPLLLLGGLLNSAQAESATLGPVPSTASLQHPALLAPSASSQFAPFQPRISVNGALGSDRSLAITEGWAPLWQDNFHVFYGDIRAMLDDGNNEEYNLGFGYRALRGNQIGGLHAWLDKRDTSMGSSFYQATLGAELLTYDTDLRFNMYLPLTGTKHHVTPVVGSGSPYLSGSGIFYNTNGLLAEEPQKGLDLEAGYRLPIMQAYVDAFRVYGGGYAFLGDETDDVVGLRTRAQLDVNPWLSIGARLQRDDERGTQGFIEATLRFPVSAKKMIQREGVRARMDESPERDVDIVTGAKVVDSGVGRPVINTETGQAQRVLYVDNSKAAGTGTKENPYNNLKTAEANLQAGDILYVFAGDGTTTHQDRGIVIAKDNVSLIGSGVNFTYDAGKFAAGGAGADFSGALLLAAGAAPVITNLTIPADPNDLAGNAVLVTADHALISGIHTEGAKQNGIAVVADGTHINQVTIQDVTSKSNANRGILIQASNGGSVGNAEIMRSTTASNTSRGVEIRSDGVGSIIENATIRDTKINGNGTYGLYADAINSGTIKKLVAAGNTLSGNSNNALYALAQTNATLGELQFNNNTVTGNNGVGIYAFANQGSRIENAVISENTVTGNNNAGIYIAASNLDSQVDAVSILNNTSTGNTRGIYLNTTTGKILSADVIGNTTNGNSQYGMLFAAGNASSVLDHIRVESNNVTGNTTNGVYVSMTAGSTMNVDLGGGAFGSAGQNRIFGNTGNDLNISRATVSAQSNWWNNAGAAPTRVTLSNGGSATYTPPLASDPRP